MAQPLFRHLLHIIRQFCAEERLEQTMHMLEKETGIFFDMKYLEQLVMDGQWDEAEKYLSAFTTIDANNSSMKMYFEIRRQKFLEILDKGDRHKGLDILMNDFQKFAASNEYACKELTDLLTMEDFRKHQSLGSLGDIVSAGRKRTVNDIKPMIASNPDLCNKTQLPDMGESRLRRIVNQRYSAMRNLRTQPSTTEERQPAALSHEMMEPGNSSANVVVRPRNHDNTDPCSTPIPMEGTSSGVPVDETVAVSNPNLPGPSQQVNLTPPLNPEDFPKIVQRCVAVESPPTSMDFHPVKETVLLVGNIIGGVELWDLTTQVKLFWTPFVLWKKETMTPLLLSEMEKDPHIPIKRALWCQNGALFGVAFSKQVVQVYSYSITTNYLEKQMEINAHIGSVNDIAFSRPWEEIYLITGGDDRQVQIWSTNSGAKLLAFQGHTAPIYSVCSHVKEGISFIFSTSTNGEIKAWVYDDNTPKVEYSAPGHSCVRMAYGSDGKRLFSGGTNKDGESFLVAWDENEGYITRTYHGFTKPCRGGIVHYDTAGRRSQYLVAGDEHLLKVWDMNNIEIWTLLGSADSLPANPYLRFSTSGNMLGVFTDDYKIKVFANEVATQLLQNGASSSRSRLEANGVLSKSLHTEDLCNKRFSLPSSFMALHQLLVARNNTKVYPVSTCRSITLPPHHNRRTRQICRLTYTQSGIGVLALGADGIHSLWKWPANQHNYYGRRPHATVNHIPQLWQPGNGLTMANEVGDNPFKLVRHCFALSRNDSYLVTASGKRVSLFNTMTFERMKICLQPPPAATCLAFFPSDYNVLAIGMDDFTVLIYNIQTDKSAYRLNGHTRRITGLAFSHTLRVLVSAGADTQIFLWDSVGWQQKKSTALQINVLWQQSDESETTLQFHEDQKHFLVVHETQLAVYEATNLERVVQWTIGNDPCGRISQATFSGDNQLVYSVMKNGSILIFGAAGLVPKLILAPSVYLPANLSCVLVRPTAIAAHPQKPNQFAIGLSNGAVIVVEPEEFVGRWIYMPPPVGNRATGN